MLNYLDGVVKNDSKISLNVTNALPLESLAFYLSNTQNSTPHLVITENLKKAEEFIENFQFWSQKPIHLLPSYDPHLFAGVQISYRQIHQRLSWLFHALNENENHIFVAPVQGLLQKTLPAERFMDSCFEFRVGDEVPKDFFERLYQLGYASGPLVEDPGQFANRGGIVDIYSPQMDFPVRAELFDREIESLRHFDPQTQRTINQVDCFTVAPAREVQLDSQNALQVSKRLLATSSPETQVMADHLRRNEYCENLEYYLPLFHPDNQAATQFFAESPTTWFVEEVNIETARQNEIVLLEGFYDKTRHAIQPAELFNDFISLKDSLDRKIVLERLNIIDAAEKLSQQHIEVKTEKLKPAQQKKLGDQLNHIVKLIEDLPEKTQVIFSVKGRPQFERVKSLLEGLGHKAKLCDDNQHPLAELKRDDFSDRFYFFPHKLRNSFFIPSENLAVISLEHFLGQSFGRSTKKRADKRAKHLSFGELKEGDYVIHAIHGVCLFQGLVKMPVAGVEAEFLSLQFKDKDKLFLPIYRIHQIHKYASEKVEPSLDKLGGSRFKNIKTKTKKRLRELAHDLIKLYATREKSTRPPYEISKDDVADFFNAFPYQETEDQMEAIESVVEDLSSSKPMDRLICGDVGFGKTEVSMRAAFIVAANRKQVAVLAPTTVLTMQHFETFKKRFKDWPIKVEVVNRLKSTKEIKEILQKTSDGEIDILIGTHRLLSKDVEFKKLGLLVVDEEQKFGVKHKERIRKIKVDVDTLAMSATPIPRTLNMSLLKIRDLSLINTAPVDRLEVRTFICRHDKEIIKRAVETELQRGGQVFFLHNRVQSIYSVAEELRELLPGVPIGVGHGQLKEKELESVMVSFFSNETKVLVASAIVESGVDIPNANTILINHADRFGLSQLYQLRGRVGRSGRRAYCYLLTEPNKKLTDIAKERLKVIQEHTSLGSGIQIAQYDLELRGTGTLLGEEQSGLIDSVGYEFYMQLLEEAIQEAKNEESVEVIEPDINLKIKAFIPNSYIPNIRLRLSYYRALTQIEGEQDIDDLEEELKDQFGKPPEEVINLLGLMLIRHQCIRLGVKDISSGKESLVLSFTENTPLSPETAIALASQANKKYSLTPQNRLKIKVKDIAWPRVFEEVGLLLKQVDK